MSLRVRLSKEARKQIDTADEWWQQNRSDAPDGFWDELIAKLRHLTTAPESGIRVPLPGRPELRRVLLETSEHHLYYEPTARLLKVHTIWGARRGDLPPLSTPQRRPRRKRAG